MESNSSDFAQQLQGLIPSKHVASALDLGLYKVKSFIYNEKTLTMGEGALHIEGLISTTWK